MSLLGVLYFFLPAYFSNMTPVFVKKINFLNFPLDFGIKLKGRRLLGDNKTFRGLFFGVLSATIVFYFQKQLFLAGFTRFAIIDYSKTSILLGTLIGFSSLLGDVTESFIKRRMNISPGKSWFPFDQLDFIISALLFTIPYWILYFYDVLIAIVIIVIGDVIVQKIGYLIKLKEDPL